MKKFSTWLAAAVIAVTLPFGTASAAGLPALLPDTLGFQLPLIQVAGSCREKGQQVAAQQGGTLAKAEQRGNNCVIVVLIPAKNGARPRREEFTVPL